jgi:arylsulfatase A-like enzyme
MTMESIDILKEWKKRNPGIKNVMIFVSDALRWDYLPQSVATHGIVFKTVASSLFTASSFPSMVTGLHTPNHEVYKFSDRLPKNVKSLMNLDGYNTSLWNENTWLKYRTAEGNPLHRLLRLDQRIPLDEIEPPFIYLEDEKGGHAPFGWTFGDKDYEEWEATRFFRDYGSKGRDELIKKYGEGINRSVQIFEKRLDTLKKRRLTEETLVVFMSDHGELLGEYGGHVGHGDVACPEVVYVPVVFIHPSLPSGISLENEGILRHVDLYPTILDILGMKVPYPVDGVSLMNADGMPRIGYNHLEIRETRKLMKIPVHFRHKEVSLWDKNGGHVFRHSSLFKRFVYSVHRTTLGGVTSSYLRGGLKKRNPLRAFKNYLAAFSYYLSPYVKHGSPSFGKKEAIVMIQKIEHSEKGKIRRGIRELREKGKI